MTEFFAQLNLLTIFLLIGAAGFVFLLVSLVVGDLFENFDLQPDFDGLELGVLDSRVLSVFVMSFGGFGAIGVQLGWSALVSSLFGLVGGLILGAVVSLFARFLHSQQASSSVSANQLVGRTAQVTVGIQPNQIGQITCRIGDERVEKLARTLDGTAVAPGAIVFIESIAGDSVIVRPETTAKNPSPSVTN